MQLFKSNYDLLYRTNKRILTFLIGRYNFSPLKLSKAVHFRTNTASKRFEKLGKGRKSLIDSISTPKIVQICEKVKKDFGSGGIRTHASKDWCLKPAP